MTRAGIVLLAALAVAGCGAAVDPEPLGRAPEDEPETLARFRTLTGRPGWTDAGRNERGAREARHLATGLRFVLIPAATDRLGGDGYPDERPHRDVRVAAFLLARTECTQEAWARGGGRPVSRWTGDDLPVERVSWAASRAWCERLGLRLPSEAEWEYAARAGGDGRYAHGDATGLLDAYAWHDDNAGGRTHPVATRRANAWGLHDMPGNVWEWCEDRWHDTHDGAPGDGRARTEGEAPTRVIRGGGWWDYDWFCRSAHRRRRGPGYRHETVGFRPAADLP